RRAGGPRAGGGDPRDRPLPRRALAGAVERRSRAGSREARGGDGDLRPPGAGAGGSLDPPARLEYPKRTGPWLSGSMLRIAPSTPTRDRTSFIGRAHELSSLVRDVERE